MSREAADALASWVCAISFAVLLVAAVHHADEVALGAVASMLAAIAALVAGRSR